MKHEVFESEQQVKIVLHGSMHVDEAIFIRDLCHDYLAGKHYRFLFDLNDVDYIDSSGLGVLVAIQKRAVQNGGAIRITGLHGKVKELFELTRLTKVFDVV